ncbi:MAG TPA: 1-(5-phosphoribosyl)-5-[(5-phosphoribosylamino)methylideneamino]imidazole-4-carboxamide isomerase [Aquifex aeolicus]|uniref:1-(5-phosphoribosyl)-5-[(5-phosphoribosylamino)methylideneamino] imidazole-4-carboxamide isomerase n=1 Tax=Aquifex aeolicus TaxID=63363 RepID=A0A9D1CGK1_AQUAO|nr:1-(5-phosphoribosyl)-5-[(5-phosphoribosylamino)methylideneamino]imidazole-4-carboxamide isomerase [Aquifex aeolicus]HIQ26118.1 1-(5-phosphoribosyl)-5-[(5-phosphoribosylamino)methylideneamino]imidazole-4-carboxamide isomerase [Aquifex aeolicus]
MEDIKKFLIPAIDIKGRKVVRLYKGDFQKAKVYYESPTDIAKKFADLGFKKIHVVDLDGAKEGLPANIKVIEAIRNAVSCQIQVGGGIRTREAAKKLLEEIGVDFIVIGTLAVKNPPLFDKIVGEFPQKVILSIDSKGGRVAISGWLEKSNYSPEKFVQSFEEKPIWGYLYTVVDRDGTLDGVDTKPYEVIKKFVRKPVIASGGVASLEDIKKLVAITEGVVVGRAIYEGKIDLSNI